MHAKRIKIFCIVMTLQSATSHGAQQSPPSTVGLLAVAALGGLAIGGTARWIQTRISEIDIDVRGRLEVVGASLGQAHERLRQLLTGQERLEAGQERLELTSGRLEEGQARLLVGQETISRDVRTLNEGMDEVRTGTRTLQEGQGRIETRVESVHSHVEGVRQQLTTVNDHLASHGTQLSSLTSNSEQELKIIRSIQDTQMTHTDALNQLKGKLNDIEKNGGTKEDLARQVGLLSSLIKSYNETTAIKIVALDTHVRSELTDIKAEMKTVGDKVIEIAQQCATLMTRFDGFSESMKRDITQIIEKSMSTEFERQRGLAGASVHSSTQRNLLERRS